MIGTTELIERTVENIKKDRELREQSPGVQKSFAVSGKALVKVVEKHLFIVIKEALNKGEDIMIKDIFTIKRQKTKVKGNKRCDRHESQIESFRRANKGKGIAAFAKSDAFKKIVRDARNCSSCKAKKQQIEKSAKPTTRITLKTSSNFWTVAKTARGRK